MRNPCVARWNVIECMLAEAITRDRAKKGENRGG
jgi:hypothetical protein